MQLAKQEKLYIYIALDRLVTSQVRSVVKDCLKHKQYERLPGLFLCNSYVWRPETR